MSVTALAAPSYGIGPIPLGSGRWATIRPIESSDWLGLLDFYRRLSPEARHTRFLAVGSGIGAGTAHRFAAAGDRGAAGFVAILREAGREDGRVVGHICVEPLGDRAAEVAVAVADGMRRHGIGHGLMASAVRASRALGLQRLLATMFNGNVAMRDLLLSAGGRLVRNECRGGVATLEVELDDRR
jgi:L-amino acid N-acyltransferase YncA